MAIEYGSIFKAVNRLGLLSGEKIDGYSSKLTSGNGAGSQEITLSDILKLAQEIQSKTQRPLVDEKIISEVKVLINQTANKIECNDYNTFNNKSHLCQAVAFLTLNEIGAIDSENHRKISLRWFVRNFCKHRNTLTNYIKVLNCKSWDTHTLDNLNDLSREIQKSFL